MKVKTKRLLAGFCAAAMAFSTAFAVSAADTNLTSLPDLPTEDEVDDVEGVPMYVNGKNLETGDTLPENIQNIWSDFIEECEQNGKNYLIFDNTEKDNTYFFRCLCKCKITEDGWVYYPTDSSSENLDYNENGDCFAVAGFVGPARDIKIPTEIDGVPVKAFGFLPHDVFCMKADGIGGYGFGGEDCYFEAFASYGRVNLRIAVPDHMTNFAGLNVETLKNNGIRFVVNENTAAKDYFDKMGIDYDINNDDDSSDTSSDNSSDVSSDNSSDVSSDTTSNSDDSSNSSSDSSDASSAASSSKSSSTSNKVSSSSTANPNTGAAAATFAGAAALGMAVVALRKKK